MMINVQVLKIYRPAILDVGEADCYVAVSKEDVNVILHDHVKENWEDQFGDNGDKLIPEDREEAIETYFEENFDGDHYEVHEQPLVGDIKAALAKK
jgi:hypothetical protein